MPGGGLSHDYDYAWFLGKTINILKPLSFPKLHHFEKSMYSFNNAGPTIIARREHEAGITTSAQRS